MIAQIVGRLIEKRAQSLLVDVQGIRYEVMVPTSVLNRVDETIDSEGNVCLVTYEYLQLSQSIGFPVLIGFISEVEKDFFNEVIKVSGIGPKAAVKALDKPISEIAQAIDSGNLEYLKTLPGIGAQRAKDIIAKLQGKVAKFGLIQDRVVQSHSRIVTNVSDWQQEALSVLLQLQYKKVEAMEMITKALDRDEKISTAEELLNEIYKQRVKN